MKKFTDFLAIITLAMAVMFTVFSLTACDNDPAPDTVDFTALNTAISQAEVELTLDVEISTDGTNVHASKKWVTQTAKDTFSTAIETAKTVRDNSNATQAQVNSATDTLITATTAYKNAKANGTDTGTDTETADKTALTAKITEAEAEADGAVTSADGTNIPPTQQWVTPAVMTTFEEAISNAEAVNADAEATQDEVDEAVSTLNTAIETFKTAKAFGTFAGTTYTVTFKGEGITTWTIDVAENTAVSKPANDPTREGYDFIEWQKDGASYVFSTLVTGDFDLTAKWEIKVSIDKTALTAKITEAEAEADEVVTAVNGNTIPTTQEWVTQAVMTAFETAIATAEAVRDNASATQAQVDTATATLTTAIATFKNAKQVGTFTGTTYTVTFKGEGITTFTIDVAENTAVSKPANDPTREGYDFIEWQKDGASYNFSTLVTGDFELTAKWQIKVYTVAFNSNGGSTVQNQNINHGSKVTKPSDPTKAENEFNGWYKEEALSTAWNFETDTVTAPLTLYAKWTAVNKDSLNTSITTAINAKTGIIISADGIIVPEEKQWVTQAVMDTFNVAIATAEAVRDNPYATQAEVTDVRTSTLTPATNAFNNAKRAGLFTATSLLWGSFWSPDSDPGAGNFEPLVIDDLKAILNGAEQSVMDGDYVGLADNPGIGLITGLGAVNIEGVEAEFDFSEPGYYFFVIPSGLSVSRIVQGGDDTKSVWTRYEFGDKTLWVKNMRAFGDSHYTVQFNTTQPPTDPSTTLTWGSFQPEGSQPVHENKYEEFPFDIEPLKELLNGAPQSEMDNTYVGFEDNPGFGRIEGTGSVPIENKEALAIFNTSGYYFFVIPSNLTVNRIDENGLDTKSVWTEYEFGDKTIWAKNTGSGSYNDMPHTVKFN